MFRLATLISLVAASAQAATYDRYAGYSPATSITDNAAMDLDQLKFNEQLYARKNTNAKQVYIQGGHSGSYAMMKLVGLDGGGAKSYPAGTRVLGTNEAGGIVEGTLQNDVAWTADDSVAIVNVTYNVGDRQATYLTCQVGGLYVFGEANRAGCFTDLDNGGGSVRFVLAGDADTKYTEYTYEYNQREDNMNSRTLQSMSKTAEARYKLATGSYFDEYRTFVNYYGDYDYADKWIMAADAAKNTNFKSGRGNSDFSIMTMRPGEGEAMKKGAAYLTLWMEVMHELNEAVAKCYAGAEDAVHSVDEAVAYYTGSLSTEADTKEGILLYALAEVRAHQSKTAGHMGDKDTGDAYVNVQVMEHFKRMQGFVSGGTPDLCAKAEESKEVIAAEMKIPLIQGVLRYAHLRQYGFPETLEDQERTLAEGATFAATVLPFVHQCGSREAKLIHDYMRVASNNNKFNYAAVRDALESTYACMGISCERVGGIWSGADWKEDGNPCGGAPEDDGVSVGGVFGIIVGLVLAGWVFIRYRHKFFARKEKKLPEMYTGNIAAVSEIS